MTSGSMRETVKSLYTIFSAPAVPYPLPDAINETIQSFLDRYANIDDHDSQRIDDDLHSLYTKHVAGHPDKTPTFLQILRLLRPALTGEMRWKEWWDVVLKPTIDSVGHKRHEVEEARELLLSLLLFDADEDKDGDHQRLSNLFLGNLVDVYLARTKVPSSAEEINSQEDDHVSQEIESVLVAFGRKRPKELLAAVDHLFVQKQHRVQALILLNAFVRLQTPHLHLVLETSIIQHLEKCLLIDTSPTVISQALMILIMFLPHITASLTSDHHLSRLFLIYSRVLCWDKLDTPNDTEAQDIPSEEEEDEDADKEEDSEPAWEKIDQSIDSMDSSPPTLLHYYTFLYGLFPLNFMSFIRKPRKFLKSLNFPGADEFDLDQDLIHSRTEPYRRVHLLHPNMFTTTVEDELTENRWLKSDPADVVMECMELCVAVSTTLDDPGPPPASKLPDLPSPPTSNTPQAKAELDDGSTVTESVASWRNTQSTTVASSTTGQSDTTESSENPPTTKSGKPEHPTSPLLKCKDVIDSPTLPPMKEAAKKKNFLGTPLAMPQRLVIPSPSIENISTLASTVGSPTHSEFQNLSMAALQREIMLLRNDLNFERYMKAQHLSHIGQLQRKHIKEATAEADTQNLINTNKTLKARLAKMNEQYAQLKKETLTSRSQSKKWEGELSGKVRSYRDDQKSWQGEEETLRFELNKSQKDIDHLKKIVEKAEAEQLRAQQRTHALEVELKDYSQMRRELEDAQEKIMGFGDQSKDLSLMIQQRNELRNELESANLRYSSLELDRQRSVQAYERRIMELESQVHRSDRPIGRPGQLPPSVQQMLDSALASNNAKLSNMKKMYHRLQDQKTELEMQFHELDAEHQALLGKLRNHERNGYPLEKDTPVRNFSVVSSNHRQSRIPESNFNQPNFTDLSVTTEGYDHYQEYNSPEYQSPISPSNSTTTSRPMRYESLPLQRPQRTQRDTPNANYGHDLSEAYESHLDAQIQAQRTPEVPLSSGKSAYSMDTNSSKGEKKDKAAPKPELRIYGRGGAQNISSLKKKEKEANKESSSKKTGGFRGLKGIM
ncbi:hypothetical protein DM02DRAFT_617467 [Periconia macrospinosa]|uniref:Hamartin n=1 Tax=Periconia macrospinosa TaxID=97972 RepID=A0A2V1DDB4_9PLEO|nr:hypothetical protein DM02DRAFT_617467 [Periconia macrospinosa]